VWLISAYLLLVFSPLGELSIFYINPTPGGDMNRHYRSARSLI
jgi:hypothetical protein